MDGSYVQGNGNNNDADNGKHYNRSSVGEQRPRSMSLSGSFPQNNSTENENTSGKGEDWSKVK